MPLPPHPGTDEVKPIDTLDKLAGLSERTIGSKAFWINRVLEGRYYFYLASCDSRDVLLGVTVNSNKIDHLDWIEFRLPYPHPLPASVVEWLDGLP